MNKYEQLLMHLDINMYIYIYIDIFMFHMEKCD